MPVIHRKRRAAPEDSEEDSEVSVPVPTSRRTQHEVQSEPESSEVDDPQNQQDTDENKNHLARKLVRYALACEFAKKPIKRTEVNAKVLGANSRHFRDIFLRAQKMLDETFGMKMEELPVGEKVTLQQRRAAKKSERANGPASTNNYVLVTTLPKQYRIPSILCAPETPQNKSDKHFIGLCTTVVSLIYLSGGTLSDNRLDHQLFQRLRISSTQSNVLITRMTKEGYIIKVTDSSTGQETVDYVVGPRGRIQIGDEGVRAFVTGVWGQGDEAEQSELQDQLNRSLKLAAGPERRRPEEGPKRKRGNQAQSNADGGEVNGETRDGTEDEDEDEDEETD